MSADNENEKEEYQDYTRKQFLEMGAGVAAFFGGALIGTAKEFGLQYMAEQDNEKKLNKTVNSFRFNEEIRQVNSYINDGEYKLGPKFVNMDFRFD